MCPEHAFQSTQIHRQTRITCSDTTCFSISYSAIISSPLRITHSQQHQFQYNKFEKESTIIQTIQPQHALPHHTQPQHAL